MSAFLDMPVRQALREAGFYAFVGTALWLPVIVALLRATP